MRSLPLPYRTDLIGNRQSAIGNYFEDAGEAIGDGLGGGGVSSAFTWSRLRRVTNPLRRYHIPSAVSQTSSALIVVPSVSRIVIGPRLFAASTFVATGPVLSATRTGSALTVGVGVGVGLGEGDGDGLGRTDGVGSNGGGGETTCWVKACVDDDWVGL